jgi:hypothetical protein
MANFNEGLNSAVSFNVRNADILIFRSHIGLLAIVVLIDRS